jgi:hypothetical protein
MKSLIIIFIGIVTAIFTVSAQSPGMSGKTSKSSIFREEDKVIIPQKGIIMDFITFLDENPMDNYLWISMKKSKKFDEGEDINKLRKIPVYIPHVTLSSIRAGYEENPFGDPLCVIFTYNHQELAVYCTAEDGEDFPGRYVYLRYELPEKNKEVWYIYDLTNLKLKKDSPYVQQDYIPLSKKVISLN